MAASNAFETLAPDGLAFQLFEHSPLGICIVRGDSIEYVNDKFCHMLSLEKPKILKKSLKRVFKAPSDYNSLIRGESFSILCSSEPGGIPVEIAVHPSEIALPESKKSLLIYTDWLFATPALPEDTMPEQMDIAFNLTPSLVLILDERTNIININDTALNIAEKSRDTAVGLRPGNVLRCIRSEDSLKGCGYGSACRKCIVRNTVQDTLNTGKSHIKVESPFVFRTGNTLRDLTVLVSSIAYTRNNKSYVLVIIEDFSSQKDLENELRKHEQLLKRKNNELKSLNSKLLDSYNRIKHINAELRIAQKQAEESDQLKSAFLANLSHEIRTPLNGILGFIDLMLDMETSSPKYMAYSEIINRNADQLLHIVNDVLEISRIETGQTVLIPNNTDLNSLLHSLYSHFLPLAEAKGLKLTSRYGRDDEHCHLVSDEAKLRQILFNLLDNALKFTERGEIEYGYEFQKDQAEFWVRDTGTGIEPGLHRNIFEHFRQAELSESRTYGGLGLGLPIARAWVNMMGGRIGLDSIPGKGSEFRFNIPLNLPEPSDMPDQAIKTLEEGTENKQPTILIVEDEEYNMSLMKEMLRKSNARILTASNGQEAIDICSNEPEIDLVLMDIKLPLVDGYTAARQIKSRRKDLPVIAHTAYARSNDREKALMAGCDEYIAKPVRNAEMMELLNKYL